ncbi:hypothetical protein BDF20DRAFT_823124 [Mycotypha africana]|uniref:uncharacterized protein n=1 Tax=Mycotypha africana TaxID=64632 RepID=UPI00230147FA|nr:uncharacterized protein BDF20DRAFT_823124 [Mycotypha africana]KAI8975176.1 hypothetical protein BDF20DRAFT_823124 [Mycotypha africana]
MDPFQSFQDGQFNPHIYGSSNVPPSTDKLYSFSGYQAGPMTVASNKLSELSDKNGGERKRYSGIYAGTGFDMLSVLSRVVNRQNPQIDLGPVDLSCSFVVVDAKQYDLPIVYCSPMFERLTGYQPADVVGRNCRFLQAPDGRVAIGSRRKFTDNSTVYHIKAHIVQGKESQSSLINYRKTGQPFVNLLTVIPISWGDSSTDEIDYFVGLQVDLVEQPNSIFQNIKNGTYTIDYRQSTIPPSISGINSSLYDVQPHQEPPSASSSFQQSQQPMMDVEALIKEATVSEGRLKRCWHELLLDESPDFIHVLTVKGIFLYCSDSTKDVLEYDPFELVGQSLRSICHPSDITTVMRELKQSSHHPTQPVNLIYRIRRKVSGYMWIECCGKLCREDGRGRKYVVLSGREKPVYQLPKNLLSLAESRLRQQQQHQRQQKRNSNRIKGAEDHAFWGKLSLDGLLLYVSWTCANILGLAPSEIIGTSLYQLMRSNRTTDLTRALAEVKEGKVVYLKHALVNGAGIEVMVATTFYPDGGTTLQPTTKEAIPDIRQPSFVLMHTIVNNYDEEEENGKEDENVFLSIDPDVKKKGKAIEQNEAASSAAVKMIDEVDITNEANWQYELHQLRITNKKLRSEMGSLLKAAKEVRS